MRFCKGAADEAWVWDHLWMELDGGFKRQRIGRERFSDIQNVDVPREWEKEKVKNWHLHANTLNLIISGIGIIGWGILVANFYRVLTNFYNIGKN